MSCSTSWPPVHPHARGERQLEVGEIKPTGGSSPRPWGTHPGHDPEHDEDRFIPTPVGNAWRGSCACRSSPVHPHARGERGWRHGGGWRDVGSSPRPWGTPCPSSANLSRRSVHPHARGERAGFPRLSRSQCGSSPRPWGTLSICTCAMLIAAVHPHARGERRPMARRISAALGSSPRPWGTPARC